MKRLTGLLATVLLAVPGIAVADGAKLCSEQNDSCEIRTEPWLREGTTVPVTVRGNGGTRVEVEVQFARPDGDGVVLQPITSSELLLGRQGVSVVQIPVPALEPAAEGGWVLVGVGEEVGTYVPFGSRVPVILGDGYADEKPVGEPLDLRFTGAIPGSSFVVEFRDADGSWKDCSNRPAEVAETPEEVSHLAYTVPRGLTAAPHRFRLRNTSDSAPSLEWQVVPSDNPVEVPVPDPWRPPDDGRVRRGTPPHPVRTVQIVAGVLAGGASLAAIGGAVALTSRGRRR